MKKIFVWIVGLLFLLGTIFVMFGWWIVASRGATVYPWAVELRKNFYTEWSTKTGMKLSDVPGGITCLQVIRGDSGVRYLYIMYGYVQVVDQAQKIIRVKVKDGEEYGFRYAGESEGSDFSYKHWLIDEQKFEVKNYDEEPWFQGDLVWVGCASVF